MKKKLFRLILTLLCCGALLFWLVSCGDVATDTAGTTDTTGTTDTMTSNNDQDGTSGTDDGNSNVADENKQPTKGLKYELSSDGKAYTVTGIGTATDTDIVIPSTYQGIPVTSIGDSAFKRCRNLISITIPDSVTSIGDFAFHICMGLTSITIPDSVTSIGDDAFQGCTSLTSITIPDSVTSIGDGAFYGCDSLTSVSIGNSVTSIGRSAFSYCRRLTSVSIGDSVASIGYRAFSECTNLTSITISGSVTSMNGNPFSDCSKLTSITVDSANTVYHSNGNCLIETANKTLIAGCKNSVIPSDGSVTSIGKYAFSSCTRLTSIMIPDSVTSIGTSAFYYCASLSAVYYTGTAEEWNVISINSYDNSKLTSATRYYYSETEPTADGYYWHYVDGIPTAW